MAPVRRYLKIGNNQVICIRIFIDRTVRIDLARKQQPKQSDLQSSGTAGSAVTKNVIAQLSRSQLDDLIQALAPDLIQLCMVQTGGVRELNIGETSLPKEQDPMNEPAPERSGGNSTTLLEKDGWKALATVANQMLAPKPLLMRRWVVEDNNDLYEQQEEDTKVELTPHYNPMVTTFQCDLYVQKLP